jgi:predicted O-methyltransferase YrrM
MEGIIKYIVMKIPPLNRIISERAHLREELARYKTWVPPGHYFSPIPSLDEVKLKESEIFDANKREIFAVDLNEDQQIRLLDRFEQYYAEQPFAVDKTENLRYFYNNPAYAYSDGVILYCMIRYAEPRRIIEVGSGYSSCAILDTNELFFANGISCTFIDPFPQQLEQLLKPNDKARIEIIPKRVQEIDVGQFSSLSAGDILFIDSTHVSKVGSDVNYIFFEILPRLKSGVFIHFHDIVYPFEYLKHFVYAGVAWNEAYVLRAFLQYNEAFKIIFFNTYLEQFYEERFKSAMPLCLINRGGSIWLQKN